MVMIFVYTEVILWHNESHISNQSIVSLEGITNGGDLFCITNTTACCRDIHTGMMGARVFWYFPNGTEVGKDSGFSRFRGRSFISLTSSSTFPPPPSGLYRCVIPDSNGQNVTLFAGIYQNGQGTQNKRVPIYF